MTKTIDNAVFSDVFLCTTLHYCTHKEDTRNNKKLVVQNIINTPARLL